jgi:hypothetical protein
MTELEKLQRDIETLQEAIKGDWADLGSMRIAPEQAAGIREHIKLCNDDLKTLWAERDRMKGKNSN